MYIYIYNSWRTIRIWKTIRCFATGVGERLTEYSVFCERLF